MCSIAQSCLFATPWTVEPTRFLCPQNFPGKNTKMGCFKHIRVISSILQISKVPQNKSALQPSVLVSLECDNKAIIDQVACKQQKCISHSLEAGSPSSECSLARFLSGPLVGGRLPTFSCILTWQRMERNNQLSNDSRQGPIPTHARSTPIISSNPNDLSNNPPPNTVTLGGRIVNLDGEREWTNIQSLTLSTQES